MPDLSSPNVPRLKARVHQKLTEAECRLIPFGALEFRPLQAADYEEMVALHTEWFPVAYDEAFYAKSVRGEIFTLAATYTADCSLGGLAPRDGIGASSSSSGGCGVGSTREEHLLGIITMSTTCDLHGDDIVHVLGGDCTTLCQAGQEDGPAVGCLAYILTLGVADGFRRRGLARELLKRSIIHVDRSMPYVQAVHLHVVTYNEAAIHLYEAMKFVQVGRFVSFYHLHGKPYDSFLYALYMHGGRPPWKWRLKNLLGIGLASTWKDWVLSAWCSLWGTEPAINNKPIAEDLA
jgi:ribosomal protein S18 acetylase RimI-like enzyme